MSQYAFGAGTFHATPNTANPTPSRFGAVQETSVDFSSNLKGLYGENQHAIVIARGQIKTSLKSKFAQLQARQMNEIYFGNTQAAGQIIPASNEGPTLIPATPFTITVANGATFVSDLGVVNAANGARLSRVASAPAAGQYSVAGAGIYTFASADNVSGISVRISYLYTMATPGQVITIANLPVGTAPTFRSVISQIFQTQRTTLTMNSCTAGKLTFGTKLEDYNMPDIDGECSEDAAGVVGTWSFAESA